MCLRTDAQVCPGETITTSTDASLSDLALADSEGNAVALNPGFHTDTTIYLASAANTAPVCHGDAD